MKISQSIKIGRKALNNERLKYAIIGVREALAPIVCVYWNEENDKMAKLSALTNHFEYLMIFTSISQLDKRKLSINKYFNVVMIENSSFLDPIKNTTALMYVVVALK